MLLRLMILVSTLVFTACSAGGAQSALLDDEDAAPEFEPNLAYLSEVMRKPMANKMDEQSWPMSCRDEGRIGGFIPYHLWCENGDTRVVNARENFRPEFTRFAPVPTEDDIIKYDFALKASAPVEGQVTVKASTVTIGEIPVHIKYAGKLTMETTGWLAVIGFNQDRSTDEDEFVDLTARFESLTGVVSDFQITNDDFNRLPEDLRSKANATIQAELNQWAQRHQAELMRQSNEAIMRAEEEGEMTTRGDDVFSVLQDRQ